MDRAPVTVPLQTGLIVIDALIPIGRGQRELILGDRQTGKSAIAIDTILNQRDQNVLCVYCAIGQRASAVAKVVANLREKGAMDYTVVVVTEGNDPPGLAYIAPYAATSIAEHFMEAGRDVLIVYDDLTHHARAYRELSLLLRRPPGREAFPGDIFYIHSTAAGAGHAPWRRLAGRLAHRSADHRDRSAEHFRVHSDGTSSPSRTGRLTLSPTLFELGVLPAVDVGKSVSRVGGKAQRAAYRAVVGDLKFAQRQFTELESFAKFGTRLDDRTRKIIDHRPANPGRSQTAGTGPGVRSRTNRRAGGVDRRFPGQGAGREGAGCRASSAKGGSRPPGRRSANRFSSNDKLSDADRAAILQVVGTAIAASQLQPFPNPREAMTYTREVGQARSPERAIWNPWSAR